jgi:hypothetical protein
VRKLKVDEENDPFQEAGKGACFCADVIWSTSLTQTFYTGPSELGIVMPAVPLDNFFRTTFAFHFLI